MSPSDMFKYLQEHRKVKRTHVILVVGKAVGSSESKGAVYSLYAKEKRNSARQNKDVILPMQFHRPPEFHLGALW